MQRNLNLRHSFSAGVASATRSLKEIAERFRKWFVRSLRGNTLFVVKQNKPSSRSLEGEWKTDGPLSLLLDLAGPITNWLNRITAVDPPAIVALGRKGPRFLEVIDRFISPGRLPKARMTTNLALPFEPMSEWKGRRVAILDDIVIWGTAMRTQKEQFDRRGIDSALFTIALDRNHAGWIYPDHVIEVEGQKTTCVCAAIVRSIGLLNKPYVIGYPILQYQCDFSEPAIAFAQLPSGSVLNDFTFPSQSESGLMRATVDGLPELNVERIFDSVVPYTTSIRKVRLYGSIRDSRLVVTPMVTSQWPSSLAEACLKGRVFRSDLRYFNEVIREAAELAKSNVGGNIGELNLCLARLCAYLTSYVLGMRYLPTLLERFSSGRIADPTRPQLSSWDLQLTFGHYIGSRLEHVLETHSGRITDFALQALASSPTTPVSDEVFAFASPNKVAVDNAEAVEVGMSGRWDEFIARCRQRIADWMEPERCVLAVLKAMRDVYDVRTRNPKGYNANRITLGLTFSGFLKVLNDLGRVYDKAKLSTCFDFLIDAGALVPRYAIGPTGAVHRIYRFGEDLFSIEKAPYVVREVLEYTLSRTQKENISLFRFDKIMTFLKCTLDGAWRKGDVFVRLYWDRFGARTRYDTPGQGSTLRDFCQREQIANFTDGRVTLDSRFTDIHPPVESPLDADREVPKIRNQIELLLALIEGDSSNDHLLAATTCFDAESTIRALQAEVEEYLSDKQLGLQNAISAMSHIERGRPELDVEKILWRAPVFPSQMAQKSTVFESLEVIQESLDAKLERNPVLKNLWIQSRAYMTPRVSDFERKKLEALNGLCELLGCAVSLVQWFYNELTGGKKAISLGYRYGKSLNDVVSRTNEVMSKLRRSFPEFFPTVIEIPELVADSTHDLEARRTALVDSMRSLRDNGLHWIRNISTIEAFATTNVGATFVVAYDGRGSSDAPYAERAQFFSELNRKLKSYLTQLAPGAVIEFPDSPNDGQHLILRKLDDAWSVAKFVHTTQTTFPKRGRVAIFDALGPDGLLIDEHSGKPDGDAHAYAERMLPFSDEVDGKGIIMTKSVLKALSEKGLVQADTDNTEKIGKKKIKGERLKHLDLISYFPK